MMGVLHVALTLQTIVISVGIFFNSTLLFLIFQFTREPIGFYKWLMILFSLYELLYGVSVLLVMPLHFVFRRSWIAFSYFGFLSNTILSADATSFYCVLYAAWLGLVLINFMYRYLCLCQPKLFLAMSKRIWAQMLVLMGFLFFTAASSYCAFVACRAGKVDYGTLEELTEKFDMKASLPQSYIMVHIQDPKTGEISTSGIIGMLIHVAFLLIWLSVIGFCFYKIWKRIRYLQKEKNSRNLSVERQLFIVLTLQTLIPLVFCGIPSLLHFSFPFWEESAFFSPLSPFFTFLSSIPKALDPLVAIVFIKSYRDPVLRFLCLKSPMATVHTMETDSETEHSEEHPAGRRY